MNNPYWQLVRPFTLLPPAVGMVSGALTALGAAPPWQSRRQGLAMFLVICGGALVAALLNAASNIFNQIHDLELDRVNKPQRPLVTGQITLPVARAIALAFYTTALLMAAAINQDCFILVGIAAFCTWMYSAPPLRTKRHWLSANLTIAVPRGVLLKVAGWSLIKPIDRAEPWYIGLIFGLFLLGAAATKDYADMTGDRQGGCQTLPLVFGVYASAWMMAPSFVLPFLLLPLGVALGLLSGQPVMLCALGLLLALWGGYVVVLILRDPHQLTRTENHPSWRHMYLMMLTAQVGFAGAYLV